MPRKSRKRSVQRPGKVNETRAQDTAGSRADSRRAQRVIDQQRAKRRRVLTLFGGAAAAALILALILIAINQDDNGGGTDVVVTIPEPVSADIPRDGRILGDPDAPVRIVEYGDYQCPACAQFTVNMKPRLIQDYIATGQVSFEYRDLTGLGDESMDAAIGAACALEQDRYWEFHDTLFHNQAGRDEGGFSEERMSQMAEELELDVDEFEDCLESDRHDEEIASMANQATEDGVTATPTLIIPGQPPLVGVPSYESLQQQIDAALQAAGSQPSAILR